MANDIVWYHSEEAGAPTLNNAVGASSSVIAVLDACLVTGFRAQTLASVVVASNVATATLSGHDYGDQMMVELSGAATSAINGRKQITSTGANTFTFPAPGVADGTIGGTIVAKRSPLGWTKEVTGTGKAIYKRADVAASVHTLRVHDSNATYAELRGLSAYTGIDSYTSVLGPYYLSKGADSATAKPWILVGDGRTIYLFTDGITQTYAAYGGLQAAGFGDIVSFRSGDASNAFLSAQFSTSQPTLSGCLVRGFNLNTSNDTGGGAIAVAGAASQLPGVVPFFPLSPLNMGSVYGYHVGQDDAAKPTYPSPVDNGVCLIYPVLGQEGNGTFGYPVRGALPGLAHPLARSMRGFHKSILSGLIGSDRKFLGVGTSNGTASAGCVFLDVTGPWQ